MNHLAGFHVLIVEDDLSQAQLLETFLSERHHQVAVVHNGADALAHQTEPDFILLDLNLPDTEGTRLAPLLQHRFPKAGLIMLTARREEVDRVMGLELGADDYVTKPYSMRELEARLRAIHRRTQGAGEATAQAPPARMETCDKGLRLVDEQGIAIHNGVEVVLTAREIKILALLLGQPGRIFSRDQLIDKAWGHDVYVTDRVVDAAVARIRKKLRKGFGQDFIFTKHGMGYGYEPGDKT